MQVKIPERSISKALLGICGQQRLEEIYQQLSRNEIRMEDGSGTIQADRAGVVFFSTFYDEGLQVQVDGQKVKPLNLEGMLGVEVEEVS